MIPGFCVHKAWHDDKDVFDFCLLKMYMSAPAANCLVAAGSDMNTFDQLLALFFYADARLRLKLDDSIH